MQWRSDEVGKAIVPLSAQQYVNHYTQVIGITNIAMHNVYIALLAIHNTNIANDFCILGSNMRSFILQHDN